MRIIFYEFKTDLLRTFRYKFSIVSDIVVFTVLLSFFFISDTGTSLESKYNSNNQRTLLLLGYAAWSLSVSCISLVGGQISSEMSRGTLYQKLNCKIPLQILYLGDLFSGILIQFVIMIIYAVIAYFVFSVELFFSLNVFLSLIICTIGMYGIGLIIAGLSIFFKKTGAIILLIQLTLLFITDTIPTNDTLLRVTNIIPLTKCNDIIRKDFVGQPVGDSFIQLILLSIGAFVIGYIVFSCFLSLAKKRGNLLFY